jgi:hypothetical protein
MVKLNRIGVLKSASFLGLYGVFVGLIFGIILFIYSQILKTVFSGNSYSSSSFMNILGVGGALSIIVTPIIYGILFFLIGLIFTPIMNLILKIIKGLDLDMTE